MSEQAMKALDEIAYQKNFNAFKVMRNADYEIRHSNTLAWLFDKKEKNHSFGEDVAVEFFSVACKDVKPSVWRKRFKGEYSVLTEVPVDPSCNDKEQEDDEKSSENKKRIDILIIGEDFTCTIENKYGSGIHGHQLSTYKSFIEDKYEKDNYFIFLDISKPDDFDSNQEYNGYKLILYSAVIEILESKLKDEKNAHAKSFLKQYLEVLYEGQGCYNYGNNETEKIALEIMKRSSSLTEEITYLDVGRHTKQKAAKHAFNSIRNSVQDKNDEVVLNHLREIIKPKRLSIKEKNENTKTNCLIEYHAGVRGKADPYGYVLRMKNCGVRDLESYLAQIDYPAQYGDYRICLYYGLHSDKSKKWTSYAFQDIDGFCDKLDSLVEHNWSVFLEYRINNGSGQGASTCRKCCTFHPR